MDDLNHLALIWAGTLVAVAAARATRLTPVVYYLGVGAYMGGLIIAREYFFTGGDDGSYNDTKRVLDNVAFSNYERARQARDMPPAIGANP